jgi:ABC-type xylose transport system substrate-binding protein
MDLLANRRNIRGRSKGARQHLLSSQVKVVGLDRFFSRKNIRCYRTLANKRINATKRKEILRLLAAEEIEFKLEFRRPAAETNKP